MEFHLTNINAMMEILTILMVVVKIAKLNRAIFALIIIYKDQIVTKH